MAINTDFEISGLKQINKRMQEYSKDTLLKSVRSASRPAMRLAQNEAKRRAKEIDDPSTASNISKNISTSSRAYKQSGVVLTRVGVRGGANYRRGDKAQNKATYWRFVEFGTEHSRAQPFLRPSFSSQRQQILDKFVDEMNKQFDKRQKLK